MKQGAVRVKEWLKPSDIDILKEMQSSGTLSDVLSDFVKYLIDKEDSSIPTPVIQKLAIEKPTNDPCETLPIVAGQDEIRSFQAEFIDPKPPRKSTKTISSTSTLGGQQGKGKGSSCTATGLTGLQTGLTASLRVLQNNSKPKMVKPKKPKIGVWKTVQAKCRSKHQKEKLKHVSEKLPAKFQKQKDVNDVSWPKTSKHLKFASQQEFHNQNRQWSNPHMSMPFSSYGLPMNMPWGAYFSIPYSCPPWFYNLYMPSLPRYLHLDYITHRKPTISESPPMHNDYFDPKNRSIQKKKYKVIKQDYRVKKDGRLTKNSDLTQDKEKPTIEKTSASYVNRITPQWRSHFKRYSRSTIKFDWGVR